MTKLNRERVKRIKAICIEKGYTVIKPSIWIDNDGEPNETHIIFNAYDNEFGNAYIFHVNWGTPFFYVSKQYLSCAKVMDDIDVTSWFKELNK